MATAEVKLKKTEFTNEPFVDFSKPENRAAMEAALKKVAGEFGRDYPMFIGGEKVTTAEKIDFLEYYGREMLRLAGPHKVVPYQNERNFMVYIPLGAGAAIPPWNFPAAIATGMTAAALVAGNTVVLKPSEESPVIGAKMVEMLYEAGVPKQALQFVTGLGEVVGDALVKHAKTRFVAFTGSKDVGLLISEAAGKRQPGQLWIKRAVLEMGGKDATIVDDEADVDAAVEGVAQAAFGYQGQKCSACSRA